MASSSSTPDGPGFRVAVMIPGPVVPLVEGTYEKESGTAITFLVGQREEGPEEGKPPFRLKSSLTCTH